MRSVVENLAGIDRRGSPRDLVDHKVKAISSDRIAIELRIVNMSPDGIMARCEAIREKGELVRFNLPVVGTVTATTRWALAGRIGCHFDAPIEAERYRAVLDRMKK